MVVETTLLKTSLSLRFKEGIDVNGKDINKVRKYSNVKVTAASENLLAVAEAFILLMKCPVFEITRSDESIIMKA